MTTGASYGTDYPLSLSIVNSSGYADTSVYLTATCHKPTATGPDDDAHVGYIDFTDAKAPKYTETGSAGSFVWGKKMGFSLDHFKVAGGNYTINFPETGGGRLYFAFGDNFDKCGTFTYSGPVTNNTNAVIMDFMEFYTNSKGTPNLDMTRVDYFGVSFYFSTTNVATGMPASRGHIFSRELILNKFSGYADNGGVAGNEALFNALKVAANKNELRVVSPKNLAYWDFDGVLAKGPQKCSHFYDNYVDKHCWKPDRTFTSYDKNNYAAKSPVYYCKVSSDGTYLNIYTDAKHTAPYSGMPKMTRPSSSDTNFPGQLSYWHQTDKADPKENDWGFIIMGSVNPGGGCGQNFGSNPVAMFIMAALARGTLHRDDPGQWLVNVLSGNPDTGQSTADYPIFQYGKVLHDYSIQQKMYALSYDDVGGQDTDIAISKKNAKATLYFNPIKWESAKEAALTMAVSGTGTTDPAAATYSSAFYLNQFIPISATPGKGWYFKGWTSNGDATIVDKTKTFTFATLKGKKPAITANFAKSTAEELRAGTLPAVTMAVSPEGAGFTYPEAGSVNPLDYDQLLDISAVPAEGYYFAGWSVSTGGLIKDPTDPYTTGKITGDCAFTAVFSTKPVTFAGNGSVLTVDAADLGDETITEFSSKPSAAVFYTDPQKQKPGAKAALTVVTPASRKSAPPSVDAVMAKKIMVCPKEIYKIYGDKTAPAMDIFIRFPPIGILADHVEVKYKGAVNSPVEIAKDMFLAPPVVTTVDGPHGSPGDVFILSGKYFGSALPSVHLEFYTEKDGGKIYGRKRCKILRKDADGNSTLLFKNARGKNNSSCMKILPDDHVHVPPQDVGYSEIQVEYPALKPGEAATGYVVLSNSAGLDVFHLEVD